ncbi:hypothetical protein [Methyloceanibacter sp.]|uniref:hypothetical protein n=1 Tax=Methyloceanibacter sp. TaxID=1965321 RepID=UPI003D6D83F6
MSQLHLFRTRPSVPESLPLDPAFIRKHLMRVLRLVTGAQFMPWQPAEARLWIERFPKLAQSNLPAEEAAEMMEMFQREIARLEQAPIGRR